MKRTPLRRKTPLRATSGLKRTTTRSRGKKSPLTKAKKALWQVTRKLVFQTYGTDCFTCEAKDLQGTNLQCGHVPWPKAILSTPAQYDIRFLRPQDYRCNINHGGMGATAFIKMKDNGVDVVGELWKYHLETRAQVYPLQWFLDKRQEYENLLNSTLSWVVWLKTKSNYWKTFALCFPTTQEWVLLWMQFT